MIEMICLALLTIVWAYLVIRYVRNAHHGTSHWKGAVIGILPFVFYWAIYVTDESKHIFHPEGDHKKFSDDWDLVFYHLYDYIDTIHDLEWAMLFPITGIIASCVLYMIPSFKKEID